MSVNSSIFYYDFSEIYRNFKRFSVMDIVDEFSFEKVHRDNIMKLLFCIMEHYDFSSYLKKYNEYRHIDQANFANHRMTYVSNSDLHELVGQYVRIDKDDCRDKLSYTCYLLDGILFNMRNWRS